MVCRAPPTKARGGAELFHGDVAEFGAEPVVDDDLWKHVFEILGDEDVAHAADALESGVLAFGNEFDPVFPFRLAKVEGDETSGGSVVIRENVEDGAVVIDDGVARVVWL